MTNDASRNMVRRVPSQSSSRPAIRCPAYIPTPVPSMLMTNAVIMPTRAPSHQPTVPPREAPRNERSLALVYRGRGGPAVARVSYHTNSSANVAETSARFIHPPDPPQDVGDLPHRRPHPHRVEHRLHQRRRRIPRRALERAQHPFHGSRVPFAAYLRDPPSLRPGQCRVVRRRRRQHFLIVRVVVHPDHHALSRLDRALLRVRAARDRLRKQAFLDRPRRSARPLDPFEQLARFLLDSIRRRLHIPAPTRWTHRLAVPGTWRPPRTNRRTPRRKTTAAARTD